MRRIAAVVLSIVVAGGLSPVGVGGASANSVGTTSPFGFVVSQTNPADATPLAAIAANGDRAFGMLPAAATEDRVYVLPPAEDWPAWAGIAASAGTIRHVSPAGSDTTGTGTVAQPFRSVQHAVDAASPGDEVAIAPGDYPGAVRIRQPNITLRGALGPDKPHLIVSSATEAGNEIAVQIDPDADGTRLIGLNIEGGFYYAVSCETKWDWGDPDDRSGAAQLVIAYNDVHHSGRDAIKIKPNCDNVLIANNTIHHTGARDDTNAERIDNVNGDRMVVLDNHIADTATTGVYFKGGAADVRVERNLIQRSGSGRSPDSVGAGILAGFDTDVEYFDRVQNPGMYEAVRGRVMNNIIDGTTMSGIGVYAALDSVIAHNTISNCCRDYHAGLYFGITLQSWEPEGLRPPSRNVTMWGNLVGIANANVRDLGSSIRYMAHDDLGELSGYDGMPTMDYNVYSATSPPVEFVDSRPATAYDAPGLPGWAAHIGGETHSQAVDVTYTPDWVPSVQLPVAPQSRYSLTTDFYGTPRPAAPVAGAVETAPAPPPPGAPELFTASEPVRVADTRPGQPVAFPAVKGAIGGGQTLAIPVAGVFDVPADAAAVSLNVTAVDAVSEGHLRVFPCGSPMPNASTVNYGPGPPVANAAIARIGAGGAVCVFAAATAHLVVDLNGWFPAGSAYAASTPLRIADSRPDQPVAFPARKTRLAAGQLLAVPVAGSFGVPADAAAVVLNVTVVGSGAAGHLRVFPCDIEVPNASNVNFDPGQTVANTVVVAPGAGGGGTFDGAVCILTTATTDLVVDLNGWFPAGSGVGAQTPVRVADTRAGQPVAFPTVKQRLVGDSVFSIPVTATRGLPADATAVVLNVTVVDPTTAGHVRVYPCGMPVPNASNLNFAARQTMANTAVVRPGTGGAVCVYAATGTDLVVDLNGWFPPPP